MAIPCMILKTSHTVVPHAIRAVVTSNILTGYYHVTKALARDHQEHRLVRQSDQYFSTAAAPQKLDDQETIKVIESEIKLIKHKHDLIQMPEVPENFPFEIIDTPSDESIILTRELAGEKIKVQVRAYIYSSTNTSEDEEEVPERREFDSSKSHICLTVEIIKENGKFLECCVSANINGSIRVSHISLDKYYSNYYPGLKCCKKEDMQNTWRNYLARRGIEDGTVDFLMEYMTKKPNRDHLLFMKNLMKFVKD